MISINDTTILAMCSRYPDMSDAEIEKNISELEHPENKMVCEALLGKIPITSLTESQNVTYSEVKRWSLDRTCRIKNEQILLRRRNKANKLKEKMLNLYEHGKITKEMMMLYAISGSFPDVMEYRTLRPEQKEEFWFNRIEQRLGESQNRVDINEFRGDIKHWLKFEDQKVDWKKEGF